MTDYLTEVTVEDIGSKADNLYKAMLGDQCFCLTDVCPPAIDFSGSEWTIPHGLGEEALSTQTRVTVDELTNQAKTGVFDVLAQSVKELIGNEFDRGRITGAAYADSFIRLIEAAMANSTQFLLQKDISFWQARKIFYDAWAVKAQAELTKHQIALTQMQQLNQQTEFATSKLRMMVTQEQYVAAVIQRDLVIPKQLEAQDSQIAINTKQLDVLTAQIAGQEAQTALVTEQTATQEVQTSLSEYQLSDVVPAQVAGQQAQTLHTQAQTQMTDAQRTQALPKQLEVQDSQIAINAKQLELHDSQILSQEAQTTLTNLQVSDVIPAQVLHQTAQTALVTEQVATQEVQTSLNEYQLSDMLPAQKAGQVAQTESIEAQTLMTNSQRTQALPKQLAVQDAQIALYGQQVTSYQRDAELKAAKVFTDTWTALSTVNGADDIPEQYNLTNLNEILTVLRTKNDLD